MSARTFRRGAAPGSPAPTLSIEAAQSPSSEQLFTTSHGVIPVPVDQFPCARPSRSCCHSDPTERRACSTSGKLEY